MSDERLRELERAFRATGSDSDLETLLRYRLRIGDCTALQVQTAAGLGHRAALAIAQEDHNGSSDRLIFMTTFRLLGQRAALTWAVEELEPLVSWVEDEEERDYVDAVCGFTRVALACENDGQGARDLRRDSILSGSRAQSDTFHAANGIAHAANSYAAWTRYHDEEDDWQVIEHLVRVPEHLSLARLASDTSRALLQEKGTPRLRLAELTLALRAGSAAP